MAQAPAAQVRGSTTAVARQGDHGMISLMTTWFTSDEHFGHKNIIAYSNRPFASVTEMNEELVRRHNGLVHPGDTVVHLGDFSLDERQTRIFLPWLNGDHILIVGNHDACHPHRSKHLTAANRYLDIGFKAVSTQLGITFQDYFKGDPSRPASPRVAPGFTVGETKPVFSLLHEVGLALGGDVNFLLTHLPSANDQGPKQERDLRYTEYRPDPLQYDVIIHGHVHEAWKARHVGKCIEVNVGVDQWGFFPVSLEDLAEFLRTVREADRLF